MKAPRIIPFALALCVGLTMNIVSVKSQNTGPTAPEAASFAPADLSNVVDMLTGDFSYVIPLLEVPGPNGGYPIVLNYRSGIGMDQEASWVGLGWNINPGAINRDVNNYPDDKKNYPIRTLMTSDTEFTEWTLTSGVGFEWGEGDTKFYLSASSTVSYSPDREGDNFVEKIRWDGASVGVGLSIYGDNQSSVGKIGVGITFNENGITSSYAGISSNGVGISYVNDLGGGWAVGVSYTINTSKINGSSAYLSASASISYGSSGIGYSGFNGLNSISACDVNDDVTYEDLETGTIGGGYSIFFFSITGKKIRAYMYEVDDVTGHGALYTVWSNNAEDVSGDNTQKIKLSPNLLDVYSIPVEDIANDNRRKMAYKNNLMLPAYDNYTVTAQGISGNMSLKFFAESPYNVLTDRKVVLKRNYSEGDRKYYDQEIIKYYYADNSINSIANYGRTKINFYFKNSYDTYVRIRPGAYTWSGSVASSPLSEISYAGETSEKDATFNSTTNRKASGKYVTYYLNNQLDDPLNLPAGYVNTNNVTRQYDATLDRMGQSYADPDGIGAYTIVNESGVAFHYCLPVYNMLRFFNDGKPENNAKMEIRDFNRYVVDWLITAITGPDYFDANYNHEVDGGDYGYWVKFDYGKWTDGYIWKLPYTDEANKPYSWGVKQIYYLNSIQTKTHTAYFIKSIREDAKGKDQIESINNLKEYVNVADESDYMGLIRHDKEWDRVITNPDNEKHAVLKLDKIILVKNDVVIDKGYYSGGSEPAGDVSYVWRDIEKDYTTCTILDLVFGTLSQLINCNPDKSVAATDSETHGFGYRYSNGSVITNEDIPDYNDLYNNAIKVINFDYSYDLCYGTPNSTYSDGKPLSGKGKLTLESVSFKGKNNSYMMPSYRFFYNNPIQRYDDENTDGWGFVLNKPASWSLDQIGLPLGATLNIEYEPDQYTYIAATSEVKNPEKIGGGVRIKKFSYIDELGNNNYKVYSYGPGVISYEYTKEGDESVVAYQTELPIPYVFYQNTTVAFYNASNELQAKSKYIFNIPATATISGSTFQWGNIVRISNSQYEDHIISAVVPEDQKCWWARTFPNSDFAHQYDTLNEHRVNIRNTTIEKNLANFGQVTEIIDYNSNNEVINNTKYHYKDPNSIITNGVVQETFRYTKRVEEWDACHENQFNSDFFNVTSIIERAAILDSVVNVNNGKKSTMHYAKYDCFSGNAVEVINTDPSGKKYKTVTIPAYQAYTGMGLKFLNTSNGNMLGQVAAEYTLYYDNSVATPVWRVINANIQTWKNGWQYRTYSGTSYINGTLTADSWRKHKTFIWKGPVDNNGAYNTVGTSNAFLSKYQPENVVGNWIDFNGDGINGWIKTTEMTLYDHSSAPLEVKDVNGVYASTKLGYDNAYIIANITNAQFNEFAYSGAEDEIPAGKPDAGIFGGEVKKGTGNKSNAYAHTGTNSLKLSPSNTGFIARIYVNAGRTYRVSVWKYNTGGTLQHSINWAPGVIGTVGSSGSIQAGSWTMYYKDYNVTSAPSVDNYIDFYCSNSGSTDMYIDDFRVHPIDASMNSYVYDDFRNLTAILDAQNFATAYEYDDAGRLKASYVEKEGGLKKASENTYKYKQITASFSLPSDIYFTNTDIKFRPMQDDVEGITYNWVFGDGNSGHGREISHTYTSAGTYNVTLTVSNGVKSLVTSKTITILDYPTITITKAYYPIGLIDCNTKYFTFTTTLSPASALYDIKNTWYLDNVKTSSTGTAYKIWKEGSHSVTYKVLFYRNDTYIGTLSASSSFAIPYCDDGGDGEMPQ